MKIAPGSKLTNKLDSPLSAAGRPGRAMTIADARPPKMTGRKIFAVNAIRTESANKIPWAAAASTAPATMPTTASWAFTKRETGKRNRAIALRRVARRTHRSVRLALVGPRGPAASIESVSVEIKASVPPGKSHRIGFGEYIVMSKDVPSSERPLKSVPTKHYPSDWNPSQPGDRKSADRQGLVGRSLSFAGMPHAWAQDLSKER